MKKIMIAVAAVAASVVANAASLTWSPGTLSFVADSSGNKITTQAAYDALVDFNADAGKNGAIVLVKLAFEAGTSNWDLENSTVLQDGKYLPNVPNTGKVTGTLSWTYGTDDPIANGDILAVVYRAADGTLSKLIDCDTQAEISTTYEIAGLDSNTWKGTNNKAFAFTEAGTTSVNNNFTVAPEPTSGLLLLLGVAGLALRRRRA